MADHEPQPRTAEEAARSGRRRGEAQRSRHRSERAAPGPRERAGAQRSRRRAGAEGEDAARARRGTGEVPDALSGDASLELRARLADAIEQPIVAVDVDGRVLYWNPAAERVYGWSADEVLARRITEVTPEVAPARDLRERVEEIMERVRARESWSGEIEAGRRDGSTFPALITAAPIEDDGRLIGMVGVSLDISERKRAEQAERGSRERLVRMLETYADGVTFVDRDGHITFANRAAERILGLSRAEIGERTYHDVAWRITTVEGEPFPPEQLPFARVMRTGEPVYGVEHAIVRSDGRRVILSINAAPLTDDEGELTGMVASLRDVTDQKRAERERARLLERERAARAAAERRRRELERLTESRSRLMRGFSHDLKNPLGAADGAAQLLQEELYGRLSARQAEGVARIRRALRSALHLIDDLLELARAEAGELEVLRRAVPIARLVEDLVDEYRPPAEAKGLTLELRLGRTPPAVSTDPARVRQVLSNLLSNAVKYTDQDGVTVRVDVRRDGGGARGGARAERAGPDRTRDAAPAAPAPGRWLAVAVSDTGPGIPPERHDEVFREFSRLDPDARRGAGLGLAISRRIARLLGGDLTVESELGAGSTFTLWLPLERSRASRA